MSEITRPLDVDGQGMRQAANQLIALAYDELRALAARKLAHESPGQTLQPTALVYEAYLRLVGHGNQVWQNRAHFFGAAAEAMRRILIDSARRRQSLKHGGAMERSDRELDEIPLHLMADPTEILAIHEILDRLDQKAPRKAELVKLRYFLGCSIPEAAEILGIAPATAEDDWTYAKAWLRRHLDPDSISKKLAGR